MKPCKHKKYVYTLYFGFGPSGLIKEVKILKRCNVCAKVVNETTINNLDQKSLSKIYKIAKNYTELQQEWSIPE